MRPLPRRLFAMASAVALTAGLLSVSTAPSADAATSTTSKVEKRRSKAVKTPKLNWYTLLWLRQVRDGEGSARLRQAEGQEGRAGRC